MRRRRRVILALLFIFSAFITPLAFFYFTIVNESFTRNYNFEERYQTFETVETPIEHPDFAKYSEYECSKFPANVTDFWPECLEKMSWIRNGWRTHECYSHNQVDGSECSFRFYLSEIERYCPPIELETERRGLAKLSPSIRRLLPILEGVPHYMNIRITRLWEKWKEGAHEVNEKYQRVMNDRRRLNVLIFIGFLANEQKLNLAKKSDHGGPLGELLQWSDLLASLSILGHHLEVSTDKLHMKRISYKYSSRGPCQYVNGTRQHLDIIFTDIMGLNILKQQHRQFLADNRCRIRLLDSFGTHAEFSNKTYFTANKKRFSGNFSERNPWGGHGLDLRQHWTFYPHSDDNTFLGFVVDTVGIQNDKNNRNLNGKKPSALVYGKELYMWKDAENPIRILKNLVEVHATVADQDQSSESSVNTSSSIFNGVINHGFLNSDQIAQLLDTTTIFFGLGFPLEGPAPLEAVARGCVFINAKFKQPKSRRNYRFLAEKPTLRQWTSQNPYMEMIGEPHVITVDIEDEKALEEAIKRAVQLKPIGKVPFEFTPAGMLLRVAVLLEKQEFCDKVSVARQWPPVRQMKIFKSGIGESCETECHRHNLLCEPSYFPIINHIPIISKEFSCSTISTVSSPIAPFNCTIQSSPSLFSCASSSSSFTGSSSQSSKSSRLCPCRDFLSEQHAICTKCL